VRLPGLDPERAYRLTDETPTEGQHGLDLAPPRLGWTGTSQRGSVLGGIGLRLGPVAPETARVVHVLAD
jgi:hypothetical protein